MIEHRPKGGMCASCQHSKRNCSHLPFSSYPVLKREEDVVVVRCMDYTRADKR